MGPCTQRYEASYYFEWIQGQNKNFEVRKLSLPTLQNLSSTNRLHYTMTYVNGNDTAQTYVIWLRTRGTLSDNTSAVVVCISTKPTLRKSWTIWLAIFCHWCYYYFVSIVILYIYMNYFCLKRFVFLVFLFLFLFFVFFDW